MLYAKWRGIENDSTYRVTAERAGGEISARSFLPLLDEWFAPTLNWPNAIEKLIALIHKRHDVVMFDKGRLESSWIRSEGQRLYFDQSCERQFRATRHAQAVHILVDIDILTWSLSSSNADSRGLVLTKNGRRRLEEMLERS